MAKPPAARDDDPPQQPIIITEGQVNQPLKPTNPILGFQGEGTEAGKTPPKPKKVKAKKGGAAGK
jgi:hypothetical protein